MCAASAKSRTTADIKADLAEVGRKQRDLKRELDAHRARLTIKCHCGKRHQIGKLDLLQTQWYVQPFSCSGGDYWKDGELQFICPDTKVRNRLLFDNNDVPWEKRSEYEWNPESQFKMRYKSLFKSVVDIQDDKLTGHWVNNYYVDLNRTKFGLVNKGDYAKRN